MSVEEARQVAASFGGAAFVPPPPDVSDILAVLDLEKRDRPERVLEAQSRADAPPPNASDPNALRQFYYSRGQAARVLGRARQELEDLTRAAEQIALVGPYSPDELQTLVGVALAEFQQGSRTRVVSYLTRAIDGTPASQSGHLFPMLSMLNRTYAWTGELQAARVTTRRLVDLYQQSKRWTNVDPASAAAWEAMSETAQADLLEATGRFEEAEPHWRRSIEAFSRSQGGFFDFRYINQGSLSRLLALEGRLLEAEAEARQAVVGALRLRGRYSTVTANMVRRLTRVVFEQGRYPEAESLARTAIEIYEKVGAGVEASLLVAEPRKELAAALAAQRRWAAALAEYDSLRATIKDESQFSRLVSEDPNFFLTLIQGGRTAEAVARLEQAEPAPLRRPDDDPFGAERRGLLAMAYTVRRDRTSALREFSRAVPGLVNRWAEIDGEQTTPAARDQRVRAILSSYIDLLSERPGALESTGTDAVSEAFTLADVARGRAIDRALSASAARSASQTPQLAELVRREQDAKKQLDTLQGRLIHLLGVPSDRQEASVVETLRAQIEQLRSARRVLSERIAGEFPAYAHLVGPPPADIAAVRATLRPDEAIIATYVTEHRTLVWAFERQGPIAFAAVPLGEGAIDEAVQRLRQALDPRAKLLGDIPKFGIGVAHELYRALLEPVASGWQHAESLLIVAHGPLGQLPFGLLPTSPASVSADPPLFSEYRRVPWLVRTHAVTVLPSVTSLVTLRTVARGDPNRRPFVGFGDPYFSEEQARQAWASRAAPALTQTEMRTAQVGLRNVVTTPSPGSSLRFASLPPLPDTADEIRSIARVMNADPERDVYLGVRANEAAVKAANLAAYRVVAFATHGLVPGDLPGLTQPALALSTPSVAKVDGDGLLTMEKILALRLNADWVVLSACNTANGRGTGAEALSGLGRAFFYAGARALLVSNWPVETTSARALTTELFRRQATQPGLSRAKALQQTMNWMIDDGGLVDPTTGKVIFSYAHPIFWAPFALVGDGG